jgi:hypothetical protein
MEPPEAREEEAAAMVEVLAASHRTQVPVPDPAAGAAAITVGRQAAETEELRRLIPSQTSPVRAAAERDPTM